MAHLFHRHDVDAFLGELSIPQFLEWCDYLRWLDGIEAGVDEPGRTHPDPSGSTRAPRERPSPEELQRRMLAAWGGRIVIAED